MSLDITPAIPVGRQIIQSYGENRFKVSDKVYQNSIIVFQNSTLNWGIKSVRELVYDSLSAIVSSDDPVDLLLIGCGAHNVILDENIKMELRNAGIVLETMDTGAACRTFNVLTCEDRRVAAALIAVG